MSVSDGQRGLEAVRARKWEEGVALLDKALESSDSPIWLLARAKALQMLKRHELALEDAEAAYNATVSRGSSNMRKLMIDAQYRRACILFQLQRYADADCCAAWSMMLAEGRPASEGAEITKNVDENGNYAVTLEEVVALKDNQPKAKSNEAASTAMPDFETAMKKNTDWNTTYVYRCQIVGAMEKLPADHPGRKATVSKVPARRPQRKGSSTADRENISTDSKAATPEPRAALAEKPKQEKATESADSVPIEKLKLRVDFYQSNQNVSVTLFTKNVKQEDFIVRFFEDRVTLGPLPREAAPSLDPKHVNSWSTLILSAPISPSESKFTITPRKVELSLKKKYPEKWSTWGREVVGAAKDKASFALAQMDISDETAPAPQKEDELAQAKPTAASVATKGPAYPTSSKSGPKDWDKIIEDNEENKEPKEERDINAFFKNLYKDASPEQQRAMMKSFVESNGTALSTNWDDVKDRTVETNPPEGIEAKKWKP